MKHLLRAAKFLKGYRWQVIGAFLCLLITNGAMLVQPQFTRLIIDRGIADQNMSLVIGLALAVVAATLYNRPRLIFSSS